jgi:hypothetical protein
LGLVFLAIPPMATASLCCPIRRVLVLVRPSASQAASVSRLTLHYGRRGQPVQKPRLMPLLKAQAVARQLQGRHIGLVAVL